MRSYRRRLGIIILFLSDLVTLFFIAVLAVFIRTFLPSIISGFPALSININYSWWFFPIWMSILTYEGAYTRKVFFLGRSKDALEGYFLFHARYSCRLFSRQNGQYRIENRHNPHRIVVPDYISLIENSG